MANEVNPHAFLIGKVLSDGTPVEEERGSNGRASWTEEGDKEDQIDTITKFKADLQASGWSEDEIQKALLGQ